jgi:hypothetical protein
MWENLGGILYWVALVHLSYVSAGLIFFDVPRLFIASRLYPGIPGKILFRMLRYGIASKNALMITAIVSLLLVGLAAPLTNSALVWIIAADVLVSGLSLVCKLAMPPSILYLSVSSVQSLDLLALLDRQLFPLRTVYLLDAEQTGSKQIPIKSRQRFELNNIRLYDGLDWHGRMREIAEFVPIIVMDARSFSPAIQREISHVLSSAALIRRTLIVVNADGSVPGAQALDRGVLAASELRLCPASELMGVLAARGAVNLREKYRP